MAEHKTFPVYKDFIVAFCIGLIALVIVVCFGISYSFDASDFSIFISLLGVIVGFLFTVMTILYAFEDNLKDNPAFKALSDSGLYNQIYPIFTDSILVSFYSLIIMIVLYFCRSFISFSIILYYIFVFIVVITLSISFIRSYRCLFSFGLLQKVMAKYDSNQRTAQK